ncbi:MAG: tyrosine-type recombinase/integrase [Gammaproteobacteria bacterium]
MLETYFVAPKTLKRLRTGPSAPYIDGFAAILKENGYSPASAVRYLRAAAHLGHFLSSRSETFIDMDATTPEVFRHHLPTCCCPDSNGGRVNHHTYFGVKRFRQYLVQRGVCRSNSASTAEPDEPMFIAGFRHWLEVHRGAAQSTRKQYCRGASDLLKALGHDPHRWDSQQVREFFLGRAGRCGTGTIEKQVTAVRAFLRYLIAQGYCRADLDRAVPTLAHWRLASLPRYLTSAQVERLLAACEGDSPGRIRDRAIILLLLRLGLRAGDVAGMRIADLEWDNASVRVSGKGRYEVRLPLPQDVGDALLRYLECRPEVARSDKLFVSSIAPHGPFASGDGVSSVVKHALARAGVQAPAKGAHLLRHTAATEMLRQGVSLEQIGSVLRHRSVDTSAYYAKVDVALLRQIAQPWPEVLR